MTLKYVGDLNVPNYTALSSDITIGNTLDGANRVGATVFLTDTAAWKIIKSDLTLADYVLPVNVTVVGDIEIGAVEIKDSGSDTRATVGANGLATDSYINHIDQSVAEAITLSPVYGVQNVAVPGTAEPIVGSSTKCMMAVIFAKVTNTSTVYVGTATVDKSTQKQAILQPGGSLSVDAPLGYSINLANWYVDAEVAGEGVEYIAMR